MNWACHFSFVLCLVNLLNFDLFGTHMSGFRIDQFVMLVCPRTLKRGLCENGESSKSRGDPAARKFPTLHV